MRLTDHAHTPAGKLADVLARLDKVKKQGKGYVARCPAHPDRNPSLSIAEGFDGRVLLHCHAGCQVPDIARAVGLDTKDLFSDASPVDEWKPMQAVAYYDYHAADGTLLFQVVREEGNGRKTFKQRRPDGRGGWVSGRGDTPPVLYKLPEVVAAVAAGHTVYVCEGEKDVLSLERAGTVATCNPQGAGKWYDLHTEALAGAANVIIVADNDDPGIKHARNVQASLDPVAKRVQVVLAATGKDATDHLRAGHTIDQFVPLLPGVDTSLGSWTPLDLTAPEYQIPPDPPAILGLFYLGRRHVLSGPPEAAKTLVAYIALLTALRGSLNVAIVDFEMGPVAAARLLRELGATPDEIRAIHYVAPTDPPDTGLEHIIQRGTHLVLIDAAIGAYDISGLDDNARKDVEAFARTWIRPLWDAGIATILIDHVTKNTETRGKFTIGSERKLGGADVHLGLEALKNVTRGADGLVKVHVHKDRPAFLPRPTACVIELHSDPDTHNVTWVQREAVPSDQSGEARPTIYMERVSRHFETNPESLSRNALEKAVTGKSEWIRRAIDALLAEGHITETAGKHGAKTITFVHPFSKQEDENTPRPNLVPARPDEVIQPRPSSSPSTEGTRRGDGPKTNQPRPDEDISLEELRFMYRDQLDG